MKKLFNPHRAEEFLKRWANLPDDYPPGTEIDDVDYEKRGAFVDKETAILNAEFPDIVLPDSEAFLQETKRLLRGAWTVRDTRVRDWYVYKIREKYHEEHIPAQSTVIALTPAAERDALAQGLHASQQEDRRNEPPPFTTFEQVMFFFQKDRIDSALLCEGPTCSHPYFFRKASRDKCCSEACKLQRHNERKRANWHSVGKLARQKKTAKRRGRPRRIRPEVI